MFAVRSKFITIKIKQACLLNYSKLIPYNFSIDIAINQSSYSYDKKKDNVLMRTRFEPMSVL